MTSNTDENKKTTEDIIKDENLYHDFVLNDDGVILRTLTERGNEAVIYKGHLYSYRKSEEPRTYRCVKKECTRRLLIQEDLKVTRESGKHQCNELEMCDIANHFAIRLIQKLAKTSNTKAKILIANILQSLDFVELIKMPKVKSLVDKVNKLRKESLQFNNYINDIPEEYFFSLDGFKFIQYDSGANDKNRFLIFFNESNKQYIKSAHTWLCDGTFKTAPTDFYQIYIVQCTVLEKAYTMAFLLMPDKSQKTYERVFKKLLELIGDVSVKFLCLDLEKAAFNAWRKVMQNANVCFCYFHFVQSILRNLKSNGLYFKYVKDKTIRGYIRFLMLLPFLPSNRVKDAFNEIKKQLLFHDKSNNMTMFLKYFSRFYIDSSETSGFAIDAWNLCERILSQTFTTTNTCEGWNSGIGSDFPKGSPSLVTLIRYLRDKDLLQKKMVTEFFIDKLLNKKNKKVIEREKKFESMIKLIIDHQEYDNFTYLTLFSSLQNISDKS